MNEQNNVNLTEANIFAEKLAMEIFTERQMEPDECQAKDAIRWCDVAANTGASSPLFFLSTDPDSGSDAQERGGAFGFEVQILFPRDSLPSAGRGLIIALDHLLLDAFGRRKYLASLKAQALPLPTVVLSYDFHLEPLTVVRSGLILACQLNDDVFGALRDGHVYQPVAEIEADEGKAA
jgi:hypothetical protein